MKNETFTAERIKDEADTFFEWDGEDRSLVTTTSCLLFAQHIAGLIQDRAAQPAPVVPDGFKALLDRIVPRLDAGGPNPIDPELHHCEWTLYQERERIHAEFAAAPAQGQQVECRECARMARQVKHWQDLAVANRKVADEALAELAALKAQQVGQEPFGYLADDGGSMVAFFRAEEKDQFDAFCAEAEPLNKVVLYTAPQPAPAQDVAGLVEALEACRGELHAMITAHNVQSDSDGSWLYDYQTVAEADAALAAHDKQSGEVKP